MTTDTRRGGPSEPCARCGDETAAGSVLFAGRRRVELAAGARVFFCGVCDERVAHPSGQRLTDDEVLRAVEGGSLATITIARER